VKRLLMLGGSAAQVNAIKHAKKLGLHVILCDYLTDNPGQHFADEYIPASTTDEKAILQIAEKKKNRRDRRLCIGPGRSYCRICWE